MKNTKTHPERKNPRNNLKLRARLEGALARHLEYAERRSPGAEVAARRTAAHLASLS